MMSSEPLVLVTGASGFIATHVIKQLQEAGYRVRGTVRSVKDEKKVQYLYDLVPNARYRLELMEADLMKQESWTEPVKGCTYVLHVASPFPATNPKTEDEVVKPAVEGTVGVLKAVAAAGGVKRVVVTSSTASVAEKGGNTIPYNEKTWADPKNPNMSFYARSKIYAERAAWEFVEQLPDSQKFELATINPTIVLGPPLHTTAGTSVSLIVQLLEHKMPMLPKFNLPVCDVRDVARAHVIAMTSAHAAGHRHIINGHNPWFKEMAQIVSDEFKEQGYHVPLHTIPNPVISFASIFSGNLRSAIEFGAHKIELDNYRFTQVLGIKPVSLEKSLVDMGYGAIELGFVKKTKKYKGPQTDYLAYNIS